MNYEAVDLGPNCSHMTVSDQVLTELGRVVAYQALVESQVGYLLASIMGISFAQGQIIISQSSSRQLRAMLSAVFRERFGEEHPRLEELRKVLKSLAAAEVNRNRAVHAVWWHGGGDPLKATRLKLTSSEKRGLTARTEKLEVSDLREICVQFGQCHHKLVTLELDAKKEGFLQADRLEEAFNGNSE